MWGSKNINFFEDDDEDFLSFKLDDCEYLQTASPSKCSVLENLPLKKKKDEIPKTGNTLSNFLHKFDFQPRTDLIVDTSLETIVKNADKFTNESQHPSYSKDCENYLPSNNSSIQKNGKCDLVSSPSDDTSFDVFFDEDDDFSENIDDSQQKIVELFKRQHDETVKYTKVSSLSNKYSEVIADDENGELLSFSSKKSMIIDGGTKEIFGNNDNCLVLSNPSTSTVTCAKLSSSNKYSEVIPDDDNEFLSFSPKQSMLVDKGMKKNFDNDENCLILSNPSNSTDLFKNLLCYNKKTLMSLRMENLELRVSDLKSPDPNNLTKISRLSTRSHKARKRKFPGPAGLLPDLPPRSPLVLKQHEYSLELDPLESSSDQEFLYSQSSGDDFLCASWSIMMKELASCDNLALLKRFNIKVVRKEAAKKKLPKYVEVPFLCVLLKSFMIKDGEVITIFKDETGEISGKIYQEVFDKHRDSLKVGVTVVLKKATFLFDQLGIKLANIIRIYDTNGNKICVNDWNHIQEVPCESTISRSHSEPPQDLTRKKNYIKQRNNSCNKDQETRDYIVDFADDSLFEDDLNDIVSTLDEDSFIV